MNYTEALDWLYAQQATGIKLGLENILKLSEHLGNPHHRLRFLHVAGTNGKGSVCAFLSSALQTAGYRTGLFTSPHLVHFGERIQVNGTCIPELEIARRLTRLRSLSHEIDLHPTFFELTTALALDWLAEQNPDFVVWETGMGGRLDSTNLVTPEVSILTPVGRDHTQWLGDTLTAIATEKAGIIKCGRPVVSAEQAPEVAVVFQSVAVQQNAPLSFVRTPYTGRVGLLGSHQKANAALAQAALQLAGVAMTSEAIADGFAKTKWPGRFQMLAPDWVIDGAHNLHAIASLVETWREQFGSQSATVLFGAMEDKQPKELLSALDCIATSYLFAPVDSPRATAARALPSATIRPSRVFDDLPSAIHCLSTTPGPKLITGSLFLVGEALSILGKKSDFRRSSQ